MQRTIASLASLGRALAAERQYRWTDGATIVLVPRWIATIFLGAFAALVDIGNVVGPISSRKAGRNYSFVPLVGALSGVAACLVCPWSGSVALIPVAILADISVAVWTLWLGKVVVDRLRGPKAP